MIKKNNLTADQMKALELLESRIDGKVISYLNSCVHCGLCGETCHYYLATNDPRYIPGNKVKQITRFYRRYYTFLGKYFPKWYGAKDFDLETMEEMIDVISGGCTMCGRCSVQCTVGIDVSFLVRLGRSILAELEQTSPGLKSTVRAAIETGDDVGIPRTELIDTLLWLEEDLQLEVNDDRAAIPLDKPGINILYTLNPREPKFFPLSISAIAKIFYAANEDWSISTHTYDVTNYAYYSGEDEKAGELIQRLCDETVKLNANTLVLAECGHGFRSIRWEGPYWIGRPYPFEVKSVIEVIAEYIRSERIKLDPEKITELVTLHDPCNLVRTGGIIEEQRYILNYAVKNFVEMIPNRVDNYCCGGGGGQLSMSEYRDRRIQSGKIKADQIRKTGAKIVATPCHNCIDQLMELNQEYKLGVEIKTISEIVADALILEKQ